MKTWTDKQTWLSGKARAKAATLDPTKVKRIAVIKHAGLGDMLATRPMIVTLKAAFPAAQITMSIVSNYIKGVAEDIVDRVHIAKGNDKKYSINETLKSYKELGAQDIIFDIAATSRSFWISKLTPATLKIGYKHKGLHRFIYDIAIPRAYYRFEAETFLEQVNTIGIQYQWPPQYQYPVPARTYSTPYILYFPTSSTPERGWPPEYMSELIIKMSDKYPSYDHLLLPGLSDWEIDIAQVIASKIPPKTNFKMLNASKDDFSLVCHASTLVSTDTGLRHLAIAANTPTVCLFGVSFNVPGYLPLFGQHKAAIADETGPASVEKVAQIMYEILQNIPT